MVVSPPDYRLYCKMQGGGRDYCATVRDGKLCLALPNDCDPCQIWQRDREDKYAFMLINKATNKVVKHCGTGDQLYLVDKPDCPDKSVTWYGFFNLIVVHNYISTLVDGGMVMDAWKNNISDGTIISIYPKKTTSDVDNQLWKHTRCCKSQNDAIFF